MCLFPAVRSFPLGLGAQVLHREGASTPKPLQTPRQMEAGGAAQVLASTVLFMDALQPVVTLNSLWDCPGLVSQCNSAQGSPFKCKG